MINKNRKKVFVGLSGGVDSSVSAVLLKNQGYDVTGVFIKVWQPEFVKCDWREDRLDAMRICAKLEIPFMDLDLEEEYKKQVFDYMIEEYKNGRTPNPDVMCNKAIKFGGFLKFALDNGADYVATGHYARSVEREFLISNFQFPNKEFSNSQELENRFELLAGKDDNKDQSYFLWTLTQDQLKYILFPVGHLEKPRVRELAKKYDLLTAEKKDSQGLCFVGMVEMKDFLKRFLQEKRGDVLNENGNIIGYHDGAFYYTFGQRHGFVITEKTSDDKPYFVIEKSIEKNTITVSEKLREKNIFDKKEIEIENINWISGNEPDLDKKYQARIRYRQPLQSCKIYKNSSSENFKVIFDEHQKSASSGQSVVFYDGEVCLGGGIIC
ncbi:TPA: tRNA 2-thiouridine(34) synthase MnmA [Candidatus Campbellbacteria bacterium]|nr:MAG: tRNA (5-methylaminomethyl-2-thiouridylate)-methyltransferase, tRNA-specific 2-thiouridylase [Candidatus Campbellbacteria bacterium GW2011_OD1_34_28]KKP74610.1 MAG: tRNA-specific 2-thiouridylase MnmA [Candidatus Campbellbacteria bacterium GW2011_GWD2_35_24]KKP76742.1 MAG: tRNA-specific 2-thiouridylase MnmA [Candidatus Campbellbacteria bacterium GW2011_GWC1_35_31]KKP78687.1 MAG: tRNA-specific 2-thiouridylase MnmA [Candidatus Campbellbacteria bacterium GW2011_GWD1_35_49]HAP74372.1 tRNA 2-t